MPYYVYILECTDGSLYTGIAKNVNNRFQTHLSGKGAAYTKIHPPKKIVYQIKLPDRSTALKTEYRIKQLNKKAKTLLIASKCHWESI